MRVDIARVQREPDRAGPRGASCSCDARADLAKESVAVRPKQPERAENNDHRHDVHDLLAELSEEGEDLAVVGVPRRAVVMPEERVGCEDRVDVLAVERLWQDPDLLDGSSVFAVPERQNSREEHGSGWRFVSARIAAAPKKTVLTAEHDGRVRGKVGVVESHQVVDDRVDKRSSRFASHHVVTNANGLRGRQDDRVPKERVDRLAAANVEVKINTAILVQNEIADSVCSLDVVRIALECWEELQI